jgi:secreted Zn-dependent insulinase-like peptidase
VFDEMNQMGEIRFRFAEKQEPGNYVVSLASLLQRYDENNISGILKNSYVQDRFYKEKLS